MREKTADPINQPQKPRRKPQLTDRDLARIRVAEAKRKQKEALSGDK
jgi:hypothetical protein